MIHMKLCPNCKTIQKGGTTCGICRCPVPDGHEIDHQERLPERQTRKHTTVQDHGWPGEKV